MALSFFKKGGPRINYGWCFEFWGFYSWLCHEYFEIFVCVNWWSIWYIYCIIYMIWIQIAGLDWFELQKYNGWCREDQTHCMLLTCNFAAFCHLAAIWCFNTAYHIKLKYVQWLHMCAKLSIDTNPCFILVLWWWITLNII